MYPPPRRASDTATTKNKMMYASTKDFLKSYLDGLGAELQVAGEGKGGRREERGCKYPPKLNQNQRERAEHRQRRYLQAIIRMGWGAEASWSSRASGAGGKCLRPGSVARTTAQDRHADATSKTHDLPGDQESSSDEGGVVLKDRREGGGGGRALPSTWVGKGAARRGRCSRAYHAATPLRWTNVEAKAHGI